MNNEKKQSPRCPYCGAEMTLEDNEDVLFGLFGEEKMYWYQCNTPSCGIHSPATHTKVGAYRAAALARWQKPNRVLTLEEVLVTAYDDCNTEQETVMYLECREEYEGYAIVTDMEADGDSNILLEFSGIGSGVKPNEKDYGSFWRCWLRKPTKDEREAAKWLPEKKEEGDDE